MAHFVGLDVSVKETAVCVVDEVGEVVLEQKVPSEPDDIVTLLTSIGEAYGRVGIEAGPLSQWLFKGLAGAGLPVVCVETRHMQALLKGQQINKSDRNGQGEGLDLNLSRRSGLNNHPARLVLSSVTTAALSPPPQATTRLSYMRTPRVAACSSRGGSVFNRPSGPVSNRR